MNIRLYSFASRTILLPLLAALLFACQDSEEMKPTTIADIIARNDDFSILRSALRHAGYSDELRTENLTFFAPNNQAFTSAGITAQTITRLDPDSLRKVFQYYLLPGKYSAEELAATGQNGVSTVARTNIFFKKKNEIVYANGSRILSGDIKTDNGTLHVIDKPFTPPVGNLLEVIAAHPQYSLFNVAVSELLINDEIKQIFMADTSRYTVFAPTNQAFAEGLSISTPEAVRLANKTVLKNIISYHIVRSRIFSGDFSAGSSLTAISLIPISVQITPDIKLLGRTNGVDFATIIQKDMMATNGLVHGIDRVLKP